MSTNLPVPTGTQLLAVPDDELQALLRQAEVYVRSGVLPPCIDTPQKALSIALRGRELGLPMQAALQNIYPIEGRTMLSARLTLALLKRGGYRVIPVEVSSERASYKFISPRGEEFTYTVTWDEAQEAKWNVRWDKQGQRWVEKPAWRGAGGRRLMLANRCITQGANMFAADALLGLEADGQDESLMVWDPDDETYVAPEEAERHRAQRERDSAMPASPRTHGPLKETGPADAAWTRSPREREALRAWLAAHGLSEDEAKAIAGRYLGRSQPLSLFSEWPHGPVRLRHVLLAWLMRHRPADPSTHWINDRRAKARFWAQAGQVGCDEEQVHRIIPSLHRWPGTAEEALDFVLRSLPEDRNWTAGEGPEAAADAPDAREEDTDGPVETADVAPAADLGDRAAELGRRVEADAAPPADADPHDQAW